MEKETQAKGRRQEEKKQVVESQASYFFYIMSFADRHNFAQVVFLDLENFDSLSESASSLEEKNKLQNTFQLFILGSKRLTH